MKLLITTTVDENYLPYKDLFEWCVKKAYPEYYVGVSVLKDCPVNIAAINRFLMIDKSDFEYVYITDVDILILPELVPLHTFHIREMEASGLCYSNVISWLNKKQGASDYEGARMMGTHFVRKDFFNRTEEASSRYRSMLCCIHDLDPIKSSADEEILFKIIHESGLGLPKIPYSFNNRLHGIHLGNFRKNKPWIWDATMTSERAAQYRELRHNDEFNAIVKDACERSPMIKEQFSRLDGAVRTRYA